MTNKSTAASETNANSVTANAAAVAVTTTTSPTSATTTESTASRISLNNNNNNNNDNENNNNDHDLQVREESKLVAGVALAAATAQEPIGQPEKGPPETLVQLAQGEAPTAVKREELTANPKQREDAPPEVKQEGTSQLESGGLKRPADESSPEAAGAAAKRLKEDSQESEENAQGPTCTPGQEREAEGAQLKVGTVGQLEQEQQQQQQQQEEEEEEVPALVSHGDDGHELGAPSEPAVKLEAQQQQQAVVAGGPGGEQPEYTMLTPAASGGPTATGNLSANNRPQQSSTTATILTDLDAAGQPTTDPARAAAGHQQQHETIQQDGSSSSNLEAGGSTTTATGQVKAEPQQEVGAAPLTELAPVAVGGTTFSELTSVNPISIHELQSHQSQQHQQNLHHNPHQQQGHLQQSHHDQQQVPTIHHHGQQQRMGQQVNQLSESYLVGGGAHQPGGGQHHLQHAHLMAGSGEPDQMAHLTATGAYSINSQTSFLVAGGPGPGQQQQGQQSQEQPNLVTLVGSQPAGGDLLSGSGSNQGDSASQPATGGGPGQPRPFSQTTGPPSVSSVLSTDTAPGSAATGKTPTGATTTGGGGGKRRAWNQLNRQANKTEIAKLHAPQSFRCFLEAPISTCRRKEEDRITYINKGEFYGLTLDYAPDPQRPIRSAIVKAVVMLVFREDKSIEEDMKSWQFWHSRQHSAKQRILDVDNKNHVGVINQIEEVSLNAIAFYWNPIETRQAKLNIAIQCLSTDFSNQKGVKGLPLNLQVDIYDLFTETSTPFYRGYTTLLSYCDKGAQRRSRDEERRALKRKLTDQSAGSTAGASTAASKKFDDLYHKPCDRSEFYAMADLVKAPTLYSPSEQEALGLAASDTSSSSATGGGGAGGSVNAKQPMSQASGISVTPISATTPIPATGGATAPGGLTPVPVAVQDQTTVAGLATPTGALQQVGYVATAPVGGHMLAAGPRQGAPFGLGPPNATAVVGHAPPGPYGTIITTADYMATPHGVVASVGGPMVPAGAAGMVAMSPIQQQPHLGGHPGQVQAQQQMGQMMTQQQQQHHGQHHPQQQQQQQQAATAAAHHQHAQQQHNQQHQQQQAHHQQQQQQHHYHTMTSQPSSYGIQLQAPTPNELQQQHIQQHQQQQYAILQPSMGMQGGQHAHQQQQQQQAQQQQQQQQQQHHHHQQMMQGQHAARAQNASQAAHHQAVMGGGGMMQQQQQQQSMQQYGQQPGAANNLVNLQPPAMSQQQQFAKRSKMYPDERVLIYAKQADEKDFYPLHLSPPSLSGLVYAIEQKYKIDSSKIANIYKKSKKGIRVQMDDEMIRHYCNEDMVQLEVIQTTDSRLEITLVEL